MLKTPINSTKHLAHPRPPLDDNVFVLRWTRFGRFRCALMGINELFRGTIVADSGRVITEMAPRSCTHEPFKLWLQRRY